MPLMDQREVQAAIAEAVAHWSPQLRCGSEINAVALMRAVCQNETVGGVRWAATLHEPAYCYGGLYYKGDGGVDLRNLTGTWGCLAHQSYGPWQVLFITAYEHGFRDDPLRLRDPQTCAEYFAKILNRRLFDKETLPVPTLDDAFAVWNSGQRASRAVNPKYVEDGTKHYHAFMGDLVI
jgi:hypothetical protein